MRRTAVAILIVCFQGTSVVVHAATHYVSKSGSRAYPYDSWESAADTVARAVEAASDWDTILIAAGHFVTDSIRMKRGQALIGSGMDSTILDTFPVGYVFPIDANDSCLLTNFALEFPRDGASRAGGSMRSPDVVFPAIRVQKDQATTIRRLRFIGIVVGIGATLQDLSRTGRLCVIDSCEFLYFHAAIGTYAANIQVTNCIFQWDRFVTAGAITADYTHLVVLNSQFIGDDPYASVGGDVAVNTYRCDPIVIRNCFFRSTIGAPALQLNENDGITAPVTLGLIENNTFVGFMQQLRTNRPGFVFRNNISTLDRASSMAAAFYGGWAVGEYNITWNNSPWDSGVIRGGDTIPNDRPGNHDNRDTLPMFVDTVDCLLQAFSPAIDAGDPTLLDADGSRSDIGYTGGPGGFTYDYLDLPPAVPKGFTDGGFQDAKQSLTWRRNSESDFAKYELFRDVLPIESADSTLLRAVITTDTTYADTLEMPLFDYYFRLRAVDAQGNASGLSDQIWHVHGAVDDGEPVAPRDFVLHPNYPNPFNAATRVTIDVPTPGRLDVIVYDVLGRRVGSLHSGAVHAGRLDLNWTSIDAGSGVYFIVAKFDGAMRVRKALLLK